MSESLWHDLDAWQVGIIDDAMGQDSAYATLKLESVNATVVWNWQRWIDWAKPAVAVVSFAAERSPGPHGDGNAHFTKEYPVIWLALTQGTLANATRDAKILMARLEKLFRDSYKQAFTIAADDYGENVVNLYLGRSELSAQPIPNSSSDDYWMVMAGIALRWETEV